jgi:hypothetical protein
MNKNESIFAVGVCNNLSKGRQYFGAFGLPFNRLLTADYFGNYLLFSFDIILLITLDNSYKLTV